MARKKNNNRNVKASLLILGFLVLYLIYEITIGSNVKILADTYYFYIPSKTTPQEIADTLKNRGFLTSRFSFRLMSKAKNLDAIAPGMYEIKKNWSNLQLIEHFKTYTPKTNTFVTVPAIQSRNKLIRSICRPLNIHPDDVWKILNDNTYIDSLGAYTPESIFSIFIPRNYRIYKSSSAKDLVYRFHQEYLLFWNASRLKKARDIKLTPQEVYTLASIVYAETKQIDEMPIIAGVYINRLQRNMRLESDPTLLFAKQKLGAKRVFFKDKNSKSPYNTYKNKGLPPGPIYAVPAWVIDKVLEFEGHDYLYFCANPNFSGVHLFAETFEEHKENAQRYRNKLNEEKIF